MKMVSKKRLKILMFVYLKFYFYYLLEMEVDENCPRLSAGPMGSGGSAVYATITTGAGAAAQSTRSGSGSGPASLPASNSLTLSSLRPDMVNNANSIVNGDSQVVTQCSNAKKAIRTATVYNFGPTDTGPIFNTGVASVPRISKMFEPELDDYSKTFNGARIMKNGNQANEVITCSFDPKTLRCLACPTVHKILDANRPVTICFADQNFVPTICCHGGGRGE
jgi:hypothetical protein